jgi:hypothetical protein
MLSLFDMWSAVNATNMLCTVNDKSWKDDESQARFNLHYLIGKILKTDNSKGPFGCVFTEYF